MAETINRIASFWFDWQWATLWQTAVVIGLVAVADRLIRNRAWPQLRYTLWLLVLVKLVLPPTLVSPMSLTSGIPAVTQKAVEAAVLRQSRPAEPGALQIATEPPAPDAVAANPPQARSVMDRPAPAMSEPIAAIDPVLSWTAYAMGVWLAGVVVLAAGLYVRLRQLSAEHSVPQPQDVPAWFDDLLTQTAREIRLRRVPEVIFSARVCCPAVFGVFKPVLLFPADHPAMTQQEARHILLHELAHIKRGDLLVHAGYMILATVYWFNPLLWLIRKHVQNLRELCCDATVARHLKEETASYRETLLATGRALVAQPIDPGLGLLGLFENSAWLPVRLQWLQKKTWKHPWLRRTLVAAVVALMLACVLPMASGRATRATEPFKLTLSNGGTIELIGVHKKGADGWWRPDGTPLAEAPYDSGGAPEGRANPNDVVGVYEFALRYENLPKGSSGGMAPSVGGYNGGGGIPDLYGKLSKAGVPLKDITRLDVAPANETESATIKVHLATGEWQTMETSPRSSGGWNTWSGGTIGGIFSAPYEREGKTYATVTYPARIAHQYDVRLTAVDANNVEHWSDYPGGLGVDGFNQMTPDFDLPLEDIAAFHFQTRPYTWIEFKNVSLRSGRQQKVDVTVTEPNEIVTQNKPVDMDKVRDFSARALKAFHATCVNYLDQNPGKELPKRPWSLKFVSDMTTTSLFDGVESKVRISPVQYVTSVGYFRPDGFQSLKREDFESSEATRTPILYCKMLLDAENGKGTNVLFGDGRIEWVTAEKLNSLKPADKPD